MNHHQPGLVGKPADHTQCAELRDELQACARDQQRMTIEIARLRVIERAAREAHALAYQGRAQDAYDALNTGLAGGEPAHRVRYPVCCSPEAD